MAARFPDELVCDMAETYHVLNWRALGLPLAAPLAGMIKFGIDWSWMDLNYAQYKLETYDYDTDELYSEKAHQLEYGMQIGPSVTINPVHHLKVSAYFRVTPSYSMMYLNDEFYHHYATFCNTGFAVAWKVLSVGCEWRWGKASYDGLGLNLDDLEGDYSDFDFALTYQEGNAVIPSNMWRSDLAWRQITGTEPVPHRTFSIKAPRKYGVEDLKKIDRQMAVQRSNRGAMVRVALVGYTNVGKSTLMNLISKSEVFAENKLFATLDTTVRKVVFDNLPFLLSDTVGFIRKLPTELIESFKSTLDEVREADLLVHVVDISHPQFEEQIAVVKQTLQEIGAGDKPVYLVFNKVDAYTYIEKEEDDLTPATRENLSLEELKKSWIARANTPCIFLSALAKTNLEKFRSDLYGMVREIHAGRYPFNNFLY